MGESARQLLTVAEVARMTALRNSASAMLHVRELRLALLEGSCPDCPRWRARHAALEGQCRELHRALATRKARIARQRRDAERFRVERNEARATIARLRSIVDGLCHGEECPGDDDADARHCGLAEMQSALAGDARG